VDWAWVAAGVLKMLCTDWIDLWKRKTLLYKLDFIAVWQVATPCYLINC